MEGGAGFNLPPIRIGEPRVYDEFRTAEEEGEGTANTAFGSLDCK